MTAVTYTGPPGLANVEVGLATGEGDELEPGRTYELPGELADRLVESNAFWEKPGKAKAKKGDA